MENHTRNSSPSSPAPILFRCLSPQWIRSEDRRCSIPQPCVSMASTPLLMVEKSKPHVSPCAPLKRFKGNEIVALLTREPYEQPKKYTKDLPNEVALLRERAASVAAALERAFWANAEGEETQMEDFLIAVAEAKLANVNLSPAFE